MQVFADGFLQVMGAVAGMVILGAICFTAYQLFAMGIRDRIKWEKRVGIDSDSIDEAIELMKKKSAILRIKAEQCDFEGSENLPAKERK